MISNIESFEHTKYAIVDCETGEIIDKANEDESYRKFNIINQIKQKDYVSSHVLNFEKPETFVKLWDKIIPFLSDNLTPSELKLVISLSRFVTAEDCVIRSNRRSDSKPLSTTDICDILNYKYDTGRKLIKRLISKGVLARVEVGILYPEYDGKANELFLVNPYIYFRGVNINKTVLQIFESSGWHEIYEYFINNTNNNEEDE